MPPASGEVLVGLPVAADYQAGGVAAGDPARVVEVPAETGAMPDATAQAAPRWMAWAGRRERSGVLDVTAADGDGGRLAVLRRAVR